MARRTAENADVCRDSLYAELDIDTTGLKSVTAMRCDPVGPPPTRHPCPPGHTCTGTFDPLPYACETAASVQVGTGKVRVLCGIAASTGESPLPADYYRFQNVTVRAPRLAPRT